MPITAECACGKQFRVRDELGGSRVACPNCGVPVDVPAGEFGSHAPAQTVTVPAKTCPFCSEPIPVSAGVCPVCEEFLGGADPDVKERMLAEAREQLCAHVRDFDAMDRDDGISGGVLRTGTIVWLVLAGITTAFFAAGVLGCVMVRRPEEWAEMSLGFSIMFGIFLVPTAIVKLVRDMRAHSITRRETPGGVLKRYMAALLTGRGRKAYVAVAPAGRRARDLEPLRFKSVAENVGRGEFANQDGFQSYWKRVVKGPNGQIRIVRLKGVEVLEESADAALCNVTYTFAGYPTWMYLFFLFPGPVPAIIILTIVQMSVQQKVAVQKLMFRENGMWFIAEGAFEGPLDRTQ